MRLQFPGCQKLPLSLVTSHNFIFFLVCSRLDTRVIIWGESRPPGHFAHTEYGRYNHEKNVTSSCPDGYELACTKDREPDNCSGFPIDMVDETLRCRDLGCVSVVPTTSEFSS